MRRVVEKQKLSAEEVTERKKQLKRKLINAKLVRRYYDYIKFEYGLTPEIEQTLLKAPPLGIHGMLEKNVGPMLGEARKSLDMGVWPPKGVFYGHFYYLGPDRRRIDQKLLCSVFFRSLESAVGGENLVLEKGSLRFAEDRPAIMLALQKPKAILHNIKDVALRGNSFYSGLRVIRDLFPVEFFGTPITFEEKELLRSNKGEPITSPLLYRALLIRLFLAKIVKAVKEYKRKYGQHPSVRY